jgi:hypothetical protein
MFSNRDETKNRSHCERCVGAAISDVLQMRHDMDRGAGRGECEKEICPKGSSLGLQEGSFQRRIRGLDVMSTGRAGFFYRDSGMLIDGAAWRFRRQ